MSPPVVEQIISVLNLLLDENEENEGLLMKIVFIRRKRHFLLIQVVDELNN
jgi:hypothetical protein